MSYLRDKVRPWINEWGLIAVFVTVKLLLHFTTNTIYEVHRDGLLYIELGKHLSWGYQSVPPSIAVFASLSRFLFGDTAFGINFFPAIIGAISLIIIGIMVKEMGGNKMAQFIALLAFLISPSFLRSNSLFQPVSFDEFYWFLLAFLIFRLIKTEKPSYWIWIGVTAGVAFLNKYLVVFFIIGLVASILLTPLRKWLKSPYPYIGSLIALLIALPNLIWQYRHNWPVVRHMHELTETQLVNVRIDIFLIDQLMMNIAPILIWIPGLIFILFNREGKKYRILGLAYIFTILLLIIFRGKSYYTLGLYPMLFAFGGFALARWLQGKLIFLRNAVIVITVIIGIISLPFSLPILNPEQFIRFSKIIGMENSQRWEEGEYHELPQDYADMIGWEELAKIVSDTYDNLTPTEKEHCTIFANNYGEAGAINFYGKKLGLPTAISFNDSYLDWAPDSIPGDCLIKVGESDDVVEMYNDVRIVGRISTPHAREFGVPVYLFKDPKTDFRNYYMIRLNEIRGNN
jgi:hypothetical protein